MSNPITSAVINEAFSYAHFLQMTEQLLTENKTTGTNHSEAMVGYTRLNMQRMSRVEKTVKLRDELTNRLSGLTDSWLWLVMVEAWCGDVPANLPIIQKMADASPNIELKLILRDEHPLVMDAHLTNGTSRAIPKLVCIQPDSLEVIGNWGPRPAPAQKMVMDYKANPNEPYMEFVKKVQLWYAKDRGKTIQDEFFTLIDEWSLQ